MTHILESNKNPIGLQMQKENNLSDKMLNLQKKDD